MAKILIKNQFIFNTPNSFLSLNDWIEKHDASTRTHIYVAIGMYQNWLCREFSRGNITIHWDEEIEKGAE